MLMVLHSAVRAVKSSQFQQITFKLPQFECINSTKSFYSPGQRGRRGRRGMNFTISLFLSNFNFFYFSGVPVSTNFNIFLCYFNSKILSNNFFIIVKYISHNIL